MKTLHEQFTKTINNIGFEKLIHPIFYNAKFGIRFEIGNPDIKSYIENEINYEYISSAIDKAKALYQNLPHQPDILRIDIYPEEEIPSQNLTLDNLYEIGLKQPTEVCGDTIIDDDLCYTARHLYWDLKKTEINLDVLLKSIIMSDFGHFISLSSNVYFINVKDDLLFHLYDDRGADIVSKEKEILIPLYIKFNDLILDYDREKIDNVFANSI
ncbi:MAG: DUF3885 domain-containing protein [Bacillota bacterium]|jgi:hypothetical protein|nr:DUF3885 domain-containing protein [Bacillota bacterium]